MRDFVFAEIKSSRLYLRIERCTYILSASVFDLIILLLISYCLTHYCYFLLKKSFSQFIRLTGHLKLCAKMQYWKKNVKFHVIKGFPSVFITPCTVCLWTAPRAWIKRWGPPSRLPAAVVVLAATTEGFYLVFFLRLRSFWARLV